MVDYVPEPTPHDSGATWVVLARHMRDTCCMWCSEVLWFHANGKGKVQDVMSKEPEDHPSYQDSKSAVEKNDW